MNMVKKQKTKQQTWFKPVRGSYLPASMNGWLTYIPFLAYCVAVPFIVFNENASLSFQIYVVLNQWLLASLVLTMIAQKKS